MHISHYRTRNCEITILDNLIIQTELNDGEILELDDIIEVIGICRRIARDRKHHSLMIPGENSNISGEAREYLVENVEWASSLSLVSNTLAHKILFNFSMRALKIDIPNKRHTTTWQAKKWIEELDND